MHPSFEQLLLHASQPLSDEPPNILALSAAGAGSLAPELIELLCARNGFFAFGPALHLFPSASTSQSWGLIEWNMPGLWKYEYQFVDPGLCFAEDIFGNQFSVTSEKVYYFHVETGNLVSMASSIAEWADLVISDHRFWTGWPIAQEWVEHNGPLPLHTRLRPALLPFCCGGTYEIGHLKAVDAAEVMTVSGSFARQIQKLPDGTSIKIVIEPEPTDET
jgi:hypothetical protein